MNGCPWVPPIYGAFNLPDTQIAKKLDECQECDVLISHGPPMGILDINMHHKTCGSPAMLEAVIRLKPKIHCYGHIHNRGGQVMKSDDTIFVNASMNYGQMKPPKEYIELEI